MICKLDGIALTAHAPIRWGRVGGVSPFSSTILTGKARAEKIFTQAKGRGVELEITQNGVTKLFKNIWVIGMGAGDGPHTRRLTIADWRWALPRIWITKDANLQRVSVERRLRGPTLEVATLVPEQAYAPHSLRAGQPYDARGLLEDVSTDMSNFLFEIGVQTVVAPLPENIPTIEVLNWPLDHPGDEAISLLLTRCPGLQLEADADGQARFYFESGLQERAEVDGALAYAEPGNQYPVVMDRERFRPSSVHVYFDKRMELLFQYRESLTGISTSSRTADWDLINVVQVSEPTADSFSGNGFGSWVPIQDYVAWLTTQPRPAAATGDSCRPSMAWLQRNFMSGFSAMRRLFRNGANTDALWAARFDTLLSAYRQTFAVSQFWYERLQGIEATRNLAYSPSLNIRAPAEAYCNYTTRPTYRQIDTASGGHSVNWTAVHDGVYTYNQDVTALNPAPFEVQVADHDAMVIRLVPKAEVTRLGERPIPAVPVNPVQVDSPRHINSLNSSLAQGLWEQMVAQPTWDLAVILTATIATPNTRGRFHEEIVTPAEAQEVVKNVVIGPSTGPAVTLRCEPGLLMARSSWLGSQANVIRQVAEQGEDLTAPFFDNPKAVRDVAVAMAARVYESLCDRLSGEQVRVSYRPEMKPAGALNQVMHEVEMSGRVVTKFSFAQAMEPRDFQAFLPPSTRKLIQRVATDVRRR